MSEVADVEATLARLELALGEPAAAEVRAILEEAVGGEWSLVAADWMTNMGERSPLPIVQLALKLRVGAAIRGEPPALSPPMWLAAAHGLARLLLRADRDRAERELAALPPALRRHRLREGARQVRAAVGSNPSPEVLARLSRAWTHVDRRIRLHALAATRRPASRAARGRSAARRPRRRCRSPGRRSSSDDPDPDAAGSQSRATEGRLSWR
jgi:hypothetical protein